VSLEQLQRIVPETAIYKAEATDVARSPGMRHKHYSPTAKVVLSRGSRVASPGKVAAYIGLNQPDDGFERVKICASVEEYAHSVFEFFRECDRQGIETIYCEPVKETGIGAALMDRLRRAAE
jgi:L-threonylcarbamoyladenylate synthase